jgi:hypothetical protein
MTQRLASLLLLVGLLVPRSAGADPLDDQIARVVDPETMHFVAQVARRSLERFRRSATLGPTLSVAPAMTLDDDHDTDFQIAGGLALLRYDVPPFPTPDQIRSILFDGMKDAVVAQIRAAEERGQVLSSEEQQRIVMETWQAIKDELLLKLRPRRFEKPQFEVMGEVAYLTSSEAWDVRALIGIGFSRVFIAAGASMQYDNDAVLVIPVELSVPVLLTDGLRSPVAQVFVRADFAITGGDDEVDRAFAGVRFALDVL